MRTSKGLVAAMLCAGVLLCAPPPHGHITRLPQSSTARTAVTSTASSRSSIGRTLTRTSIVDVKEPDGHVEAWSFQTYALITLRRAGNDRQVFLDNVGKEVFVRGCLARNGRKNYAAAGTLKFSDGVMRQVGQLQD